MHGSTVEVVAVGELPDQENEYDTDSDSDMDDGDHDSYAHFRFVNGRCHFKRSMPSLVTKVFGMESAISALV